MLSNACMYSPNHRPPFGQSSELQDTRVPCPSGFMGCPEVYAVPSGYVKIAMENGH